MRMNLFVPSSFTVSGGVTQLAVSRLEHWRKFQPAEGEGHQTTMVFVAVRAMDRSGALVDCITATIAEKPLAAAKFPPLACPASALPRGPRQCKLYSVFMDEFFLPVQIEPLAEGGYLATSNDLPGLVAQGRTVAETLEIAQDVARKLVESYVEHGDPLPL
jgi:antitoxin HicB